MQYLVFVDFALTILEKYLPLVMKKGQVSAEEQAALMQRVKNIRIENGGFTGDEWKPSDLPSTTPPR